MSRGGQSDLELDSGPSLDGDAFALNAEDLAEGPRRNSVTSLPKKQKSNTLTLAVVGVVVVGLLAVLAALFVRGSESTEVAAIPVDDPKPADVADPKTPTIPPVPIKPEDPKKDPTPPPTPTPEVKKDPPEVKKAPVKKKKKKRKKRKKRREDKAMDSALEKLKDL